MANGGNKVIALIRLLKAQNLPDKAKGNFEDNKGADGNVSDSGTYNPADVDFPKDGSGNFDQKCMVIKIDEGSTKWCIYLADGTFKCFTG